MSATYLVENGVTKKIKKLYDVENSLTKKIKKLYKVDGGVTRLVFSDVEAVAYTGNFTVTDVEVSGAAYKLYTLISSGTLTLLADAEYWMCAAGNNGASGTVTSSAYAYAGLGGGGGKVASGSLTAGEYAVTIGAAVTSSAGIGGATKIGAKSAANSTSQKHCYGESGGGDAWLSTAVSTWQIGSLQRGSGKSTIPFSSRITSGFANRAHSPGGGGAAFAYRPSYTKDYYYYGGAGGSNGGTVIMSGTPSPSETVPTAAGGTYGGGTGGAHGNGGNGWFYGAGSGGGSSYLYAKNNNTNNKGYSHGKAYQGVAYLLIPA